MRMVGWKRRVPVSWLRYPQRRERMKEDGGARLRIVQCLPDFFDRGGPLAFREKFEDFQNTACGFDGLVHSGPGPLRRISG